MHGWPHHMGDLSVVQKTVGSAASTVSTLWLKKGEENTRRSGEYWDVAMVEISAQPNYLVSVLALAVHLYRPTFCTGLYVCMG